MNNRPSLDSLGLGPIQRLVEDSRLVRPGDTFIVRRGQHHDGEAFVAQALARGATSLIGEAFSTDHGVPSVCVPDVGQQLGYWASELHAQPSAKLRLWAITGTNGKTSLCHFLAHSLAHLGRKTAMVGTLGCGVVGHGLNTATHTTPMALQLQHLLGQWRDEGVSDVVMEASSHALDQGRLNGCELFMALFTNLSRDHLDYHGDMEHYFLAKARLFSFPGLRYAVLSDSAEGHRLQHEHLSAGVQSWHVGWSAEADCRITGLQHHRHSSSFQWLSPRGADVIKVPVIGRFQISNLAQAAAALVLSGVPLFEVVRVMARLEPVPGRMQQLGTTPDQPQVVIDYAHTPDGLDQVLSACRELAKPTAKLHVVFGCGGNRDAGKRPLMGHIAQEKADHVVLTSDNPRDEDPLDIIQDIAQAAPQAQIEIDRRRAIELAIHQAQAGDWVVIAGKGHESEQVIGSERYPFSDSAVAREALRQR